MELVCPICNGMAIYLLKCSNCGKVMENRGTIGEFLDDYSPYLAMDITQQIDGVPYDQCVHLFYCKNCDHDKRVPIKKMRI
ncbi:hypothetical protein FQB35_05730 [Crassaminicella thermophila]|uniref:Uncharacterized protein n=1 Tax=Crassaminicella thermophila TaxID=2599308 RepID=A0A5C0SF95_CRATE|nr:hypothetical protein [Crassaminicella thermophila]QEK11908.1 hypothetical protein FQB35_05730 [Crassaminicella thermophila]